MIIMMGRVSVVYIMFLGDIFYESCYDFVMARLEQDGYDQAVGLFVRCSSRVGPGHI